MKVNGVHAIRSVFVIMLATLAVLIFFIGRVDNKMAEMALSIALIIVTTSAQDIYHIGIEMEKAEKENK